MSQETVIDSFLELENNSVNYLAKIIEIENVLDRIEGVMISMQQQERTIPNYKLCINMLIKFRGMIRKLKTNLVVLSKRDLQVFRTLIESSTKSRSKNEVIKEVEKSWGAFDRAITKLENEVKPLVSYIGKLKTPSRVSRG